MGNMKVMNDILIQKIKNQKITEKYRKVNEGENIGEYPDIYSDHGLSLLNKIRIRLTQRCWILIKSDYPQNRIVMLRYVVKNPNTKKVPIGFKIAPLIRQSEENDGDLHLTTHWLEISDSIDLTRQKQLQQRNRGPVKTSVNNLSYTFFKYINLKWWNKLKGYLLRFCWVPIGNKFPVNRIVLVRYRTERGSERVAIAPLQKTFEGYPVTHWLEIVESIGNI